MTVDPTTPRPPIELRSGLWVIRNRIFPSNTYVCALREVGRCAIVDPGLDHESMDAALRQLDLRPVAVFCTHGHFDHLGGAARLKDRFGATLVVHSAEQRVVKTANFTMMMCKVEGRVAVPAFDVFADDDSRYLSGTDEVRYVHAPGHTPGSSAVCWRDFVFTGDTMYTESVGLVNFPGEDEAALKLSLMRLWDLLPDASLICPGHGRSGRLIDVKRDNHLLRAFLGFAEAPPRG